MKIETDAIQDGLLRVPGFAQVTYAQDLALPVGIGGRKRELFINASRFVSQLGTINGVLYDCRMTRGKFTALGAEASFRMFVPGFMLSRFNRIVNLFVLDYD
ncbi:hypothetical protein RF11_03260 [Thelohanellus kitauei]|uniref:Uncharacterized protein n=1 Tax=Thelohanellus kitauei TaxID=669202 RepID=A0A0C2MTL8_THEKT|nr:hypothetical protein RF11_03260 [Thelohanellus kitauei]